MRDRIVGLAFTACACLAASASFGEELPKQVQELLVTLQSGKPAERAAAARILGELGASARAAVPDLGSALGDGEGEVRRNAARSLGDIGPPAKLAVPALLKTLKDSDWQVRQASAYALGRIGSREASAGLEAAKKDTNENVKRAAKQALKALKQKS